MSGLFAIVFAALFALSGGLTTSTVHKASDTVGGQPNIVMFLLDDTNPMDGRLWSDPTVTPTLYDTFVAHGINFTNAIDDTSLCCPARATLLTGLHSYNTGVEYNDVRLFNPAESLPVELTKQGYETMLVGKYMNHPEYLTGDLWAQHAAPWSVFDIFTSTYNAKYGFFYNYTMSTKDGQVLQPTEHSTQLITERTVAHMRATDPSKPIFAELSIVDTHLPNMPMPGFENDPRWAACVAMPGWNPPNYNEIDVSDKPSYVQKRPFFPYLGGWPMATYCKEMLGVDWMVAQVKNELAAERRLDNTLFVFTADNGMAWGQHRLELKEVPYSTRVPLMMSWPARWGTDPRTVTEYTSNIDLAPTMCAGAGCELGPFPNGQARPDGVSLLPLLDGQVPNLGRDALVETEWHIHPWAAVRTTDLNPLGLWHYVEYQDGFRELYNVAPDQDPWEMNNLAYDPTYAGVVASLHVRLLDLLAEGRRSGGSTLTIVEDATPNSPQDFSFSGDLGSFTLDDDRDPGQLRSKLFNVSGGDYVVAQAGLPSWPLAGISCPPGSTSDVATGTVVVHVPAGAHVTCTFHNARRRPDLSIALIDVGPYKGNNVYSARPQKRQTQRRQLVTPGVEYDYFVTLQNDGKIADAFTLAGSITATASVSTTFWDATGDVTAAVLAGTYLTAALAPTAATSLLVRVVFAADAPIGSKQTIIFRATSLSDPAAVDVVRSFTVE